MIYSSFIVPTLNREKDLKKTLDSILELKKLPNEVVVVDQSDDDTTEKLCSKEKYISLNVRYHKFAIKSSALARNFAIDHLDKKNKIVIFLDDDVILQKDFLDQIILFFENNKNAKGGVANIDSPLRSIGLVKKMGLFLLTGKTCFTETYVTNGGFNVMPLIYPNTINSVKRTSGCGMFFRKSVFDEGFRFEKRFMRYSLMEDCFLSYAVWQKYPGSLFFLPDVKMIHLESPTSRIPNKSRIYQNIIHRYYFVRKFKKSTIAFLRTMLILCIFDIMNFKTLKVALRYIKGIHYALTNKNNILKSDFNFNGFIFPPSD